MGSSVSRRSFLKNSLYAAGAAGIGMQASVHQALAQALPVALPVEQPVVNIGSNTLSVGPARAALEAIANAAPGSGQYPFLEVRKLMEVLAARLGVPVDHIALYPGSGMPLGLAVTTFTSPQASLVTADPTYEQGWRAAPTVGAQVIKVPQRADYSHDVEAMCAADPNAGLIYICSPNNPTGGVAPRKDIEYAVANKPTGSVLVVDEAYIDFSDTAITAADLAVSAENVIVLRTFSKLYGMAGLRLGYAIGSPENLAKMGAQAAGSIAMTTLMAGIASLEDASLIPERRALNTRLRNETVAWLEAQGFPCSISEANCFLVDVKRNAREFQEAMATHGVMIGRSWPGFETSPRISVGSEEEMRRFREAFTAVLAGRTGPLPVPQRRGVAALELSPDPEWQVC